MELTRERVRPRTKALVEEIRDVIKVEEAWAIAQKHLDAERSDAYDELIVDRIWNDSEDANLPEG